MQKTSLWLALFGLLLLLQACASAPAPATIEDPNNCSENERFKEDCSESP